MSEHFAEKDALVALERLADQAWHAAGDAEGRERAHEDRAAILGALTRAIPSGSCPQGHDRSAGRWCSACGQHGSHHTERHDGFTCCIPPAKSDPADRGGAA